MYTPYNLIDSIQSAKKSVANLIFKDSNLNQAAHAYIDSQAKFAKVLVDNTFIAGEFFLNSVHKFMYPTIQESSAAPYKVEPKAE